MDQTDRKARLVGRFRRRPAPARQVPRLLRSVAWLFLVVGIIGLILTGYAAVGGDLVLSPMLVGLPIGIGLLRQHPGWRVAAMAVSGLVVIGAGLLILQLVSGGAEFILSFDSELRPFLFAGLVLLLAAAGAAVWCLSALRRPHVRNEFPASGTEKVVRAAASLLVVVVILSASRLTGGIGGSFSLKQWQHSSSSDRMAGPSTSKSLADLDVVFPLTIEVRGDGGVSFWSLAWRTTFEGAKSERRHNKRFYQRYPERLVPKSLAASESKIVVEIEEFNLSGRSWMPFFKTGTAGGRAKLSGTGRYSALRHYFLDQNARYKVFGPCTRENLRKSFRIAIEKQALADLRKGADRGAESLATLERNWRLRPLTDREIRRLASATQAEGDGYFQAGDQHSAARAYRAGMLAFESILNEHVFYSRYYQENPEKDPFGQLNGVYGRKYEQHYLLWNQDENEKQMAKLHDRFAWRLATDGRPEARDGHEAIRHAKRACELTGWEDAEHIETLAAAHEEIGDFEGAIRALSLLVEGGEADPVLEAYRSGQFVVRESRSERANREFIGGDAPGQKDDRGEFGDSSGLLKLVEWFLEEGDIDQARGILLSNYRRMKLNPERKLPRNKPYFFQSIDRLAHFYESQGEVGEAAKWRRVAAFHASEEE